MSHVDGTLFKGGGAGAASRGKGAVVGVKVVSKDMHRKEGSTTMSR